MRESHRAPVETMMSDERAPEKALSAHCPSCSDTWGSGRPVDGHQARDVLAVPGRLG